MVVDANKRIEDKLSALRESTKIRRQSPLGLQSIAWPTPHGYSWRKKYFGLYFRASNLSSVRMKPEENEFQSDVANRYMSGQSARNKSCCRKRSPIGGLPRFKIERLLVTKPMLTHSVRFDIVSSQTAFVLERRSMHPVDRTVPYASDVQWPGASSTLSRAGFEYPAAESNRHRRTATNCRWWGDQLQR